MKKNLVIVPLIVLSLLFFQVQLVQALQIQNVEIVAEGGNDQPIPILQSFNLKFDGKYRPINKVGDQMNLTMNAKNVKDVVIDAKVNTQMAVWCCNKTDDFLWNFQKIFVEAEVGMSYINKIRYYDNTSAIGEEEKVLSNIKYLILPETYQCFNDGLSDKFLGINNNYKNIKISLSDPLDETTVNKNNIELYESADKINIDFISNTSAYSFNKLIDFRMILSDDKKTITINRAVEFELGKNYHVVIREAVQDINGENLSNPMWINFAYKDSQDAPGLVDMDNE